MTASERSLIGFAKQTAKGTPNSTDGDFKYVLFTRGTAGVNNMVVPLDQEVGGGAMLRDVVKVGYTSGGQFEFIPRPESLGMFLAGMTGLDSVTPGGSALLGYEHKFTLDSDDQFYAPYYTARFAPGKMWGETYEDCRFNTVALNWRGANFVRGALGFMGGKATPDVAMTDWNGSVDGTPPFITPVSAIELPSGSNAKVLAGSFQATTAIPLDQQWIVGSYLPDDFDVVSRAFILNLTVKVADKSLYQKMTYDGDGAVGAWAADMYRESSFKIEFKTGQNMEGLTIPEPYLLSIAGNGNAAPKGNVVWTATPLGLRAGQQVVMNVTGVFLADATKAIEIKLKNLHAETYSDGYTPA